MVIAEENRSADDDVGLLLFFLSRFLGGWRRMNHRARAPIAIPDIPDEIFYKVNYPIA